jgi:predicted choloylglycine hydrolase
MAQTQRTHDSISYNGNTTTISNLRDAFASGNVVQAANVFDLIAMINSWNGHTHNYTDAYQLATYGDNGDRNNYIESKNTGTHDEANSVAYVADGDLITAAGVNDAVNTVNKLRSHYHVINDRTAI